MQNTTTLGRRIQESRKAAGLSQEALGEQLGVSRQAVSKWEADATVPELDSLIAMSRIFGVSVGALLGVEEPTPAAEAAAPEGLSPRELAAVEAIAARYAEELKSHQRHRFSRWGIALIAASVLFAALGIHQRNVAIDQRFQNMQNQINGVQSTVSSQIGSLTWQLGNILTEQANILSSSSCVITDFDRQAQTVALRLSAAPKEWTQETECIFVATLEDGREFSIPAKLEGSSFTAEGFSVPTSPEIRLTAVLTDGTVSRTGTMETRYDCSAESFRLQTTCWVAMSAIYNPSGPARVTFSDSEIRIEPPDYGNLPIRPVEVQLCLYRNEETEPEQVIPLPQLVTKFGMDGYAYQFPETECRFEPVTLELNDAIFAVLQVTDDHGLTTYTVGEGMQLVSGDLRSMDTLGGTLDWQPGTPVDQLMFP